EHRNVVLMRIGDPLVHASPAKALDAVGHAAKASGNIRSDPHGEDDRRREPGHGTNDHEETRARLDRSDSIERHGYVIHVYEQERSEAGTELRGGRLRRRSGDRRLRQMRQHGLEGRKGPFATIHRETLAIEELELSLSLEGRPKSLRIVARVVRDRPI